MNGAVIIDGKAFADGLLSRISEAVGRLEATSGLVPGLATVLVGDDPASRIYVRNKVEKTAAAGMKSFSRRLAAKTTTKELLALVESLNADDAVHGILVQLPLPGHVDAAAVLGTIDPAKDVDGFHPLNVGGLAIGDPSALAPCTPSGCLMLLKDRLSELAGLHAMVLGRSDIVGKPMAAMLLAENCTVTIGHSRTRNPEEECRRADILVCAVGRPGMVRGNWIKPGATVIDVGINRTPAPEKGEGKTRLVGDVNFAEALSVAGAITPVPGGVGPMTIACLLRNTLLAACRQVGVAEPEI
ncbi:MAG TPA: bifunctional methylenetetrahydrofolate dehydrogenase/methenyltetrahydrofolate cyclohydrolase FolD [Alphaproteobacteria bacterium]|nr:bifunctional methylenetetrahydrofolate dehydrogenase/methenyltetrahydrofolate cyclohydrolase FolD [Alphaproteobacteria bacterium]